MRAKTFPRVSESSVWFGIIGEWYLIYRGYGGYYKDIYLRSSLEFAYAYYLDTKGIDWEYEMLTFELGDFSYKPDFYIMNDDDEINYIVEIKSEENKHDGIKKINKFKEYYDYPIKLITYTDLLKIYQNEMPISLNRARIIWREEYKTSLNHDVSGENNPMYGNHHKESTKILISQKSKERFKDEEYKERVVRAALEGNRKTGYAAQKLPRVKRETRTCVYENCDKEFTVTINSKKKYCSTGCSLRVSSPRGVETGKRKSRIVLDQVKEYIIDWVMNNKNIVDETPFNKITTNLSELFENIHYLYNIKDMRIVSKAIFGEDRGRKELLRYLKEIK